MKKNFSITFCIIGDPQELKNIIPELVKIGHKDNSTYGSKYSENDCKYLFVNFNEHDIFLNQDNPYKFIEVDAKDTELILALANTTSNKEFFVGEYIKDDKFDSCFKGVSKIIKINNERSFIIQDYPSLLTMSYYRKATAKEIIQHFKGTPNPIYITGKEYTELNNLNQNTMNKKLKGYRLKDSCQEFLIAASHIVYHKNYSPNKVLSLIDGVHLRINSYEQEQLEKTKVLNLWFEEVYEDTKKPNVTIQCKSAPKLRFVISEDTPEFVTEGIENNKIQITELANIVNSGLKVGNYASHLLKPKVFSIGCVDNIKVEDIEDVILAYDEYFGTDYYHTF